MSKPATGLRFSKLEALGNDFVLLDFRGQGSDPAAEQIRQLADRHTGIGFDQLLILHPSGTPDVDCRVRIYNADGSRARQCGNGMRAVALWLHQARPEQGRFLLETEAGTVSARIETDQSIRVSMGQPNFDPAAAGCQDPHLLAAAAADLPGCLRLGTVSVGNPHLIVLMDRAPTPALLEHWGRPTGLQRHFADGANVSFAVIAAPDRVELRVHERGVGPTRACGSAACATAAWLAHQGLIELPAKIEQPGGTLVIDWRGPGQAIFMQGPARRVFDGRLP